MRIFSFLIVWAVAIAASLPAAALDAATIKAREAIVIDFDTDTVLLDKNADTRMPTASMSKVMTMDVVFEAIKSGRLKMEDTVTVSEKAWRMEGSKMFIQVGSVVKVEDLVRGVIVQSGNDATIALAEAVAGSEESFATLMNERAKALGMAGSNFMNASGWPDPNHYSTPRDLAVLAKHLIKEYPDYYKIYAEKEFEYCPYGPGQKCIKQGNRNPLLYKNIGGDGVKTGHTEEAGYGLIGSGTDGKRRVIFVIGGLASMQERADVAGEVLTWALKQFENIAISPAIGEIESVQVEDGLAANVPLTVGGSQTITVPVTLRGDLVVEARLREPVLAPVAKGQEMGVLVIMNKGQEMARVPLVATEDVPALNWFSRTMAKTFRFVTSL